METRYMPILNVCRSIVIGLVLCFATAWPPMVNADDSKVKPVLMVIANQDFYHREYFETRESLEAAGLEVVVAAATTETATPHAVKGAGNVPPDLALSDVDAEDYAAIVFVGGYGAASYQYANETTYDNPAYNNPEAAFWANFVINEFVEQDKYVAAVCYGVSVLAYAEVDGESLLDGRTVTGWNGAAPSSRQGASAGTKSTLARWQIEDNGATMLHSGELGEPFNSADDVFIDGKIITAENFDAAHLLGRVLARRIK